MCTFISIWHLSQLHFSTHSAFCKAYVAACDTLELPATAVPAAVPVPSLEAAGTRSVADETGAAVGARLLSRRRRLCAATATALHRALTSVEIEAIVLARACSVCSASPTLPAALRSCDHCGHGFHCTDNAACVAGFPAAHPRALGVCSDLAIALAVQQVSRAAVAAGRSVPFVFVPPLPESVYLPLVLPAKHAVAPSCAPAPRDALSGWDAGVHPQVSARACQYHIGCNPVSGATSLSQVLCAVPTAVSVSIATYPASCR